MKTPAQKAANTHHANYEAKWAHKRAACIATLREPRSVGYTARLHGVPETAVKNWQREEGIPAYVGPKRAMPDVVTA